MENLSIGKLDPLFLEKLFQRYLGEKSKRVIIGPEIGEDAAVIDYQDRYLVVKTDPITFTSEEIGYYSVNINANDIAVMGAKPKWFLATILLPKKSKKDLIQNIFSQISKACKDLNIFLIGGHTEITPNLVQPIVVGTMLGELKKKKLVKSSGAKVGDKILITKGIFIEGTSILAKEKEKELREAGFKENFIRKCKKYLKNPGISIIKEALIANKFKINSMHDPTEGGLAMGLFEVAKASNKGFLIEKEKIPILNEAKILAGYFQIDPLSVLTSGTLIFTCKSQNSKKILREFKKARIPAFLIGEIKNKNYGMRIKENNKIIPLRYNFQDEILKIL